MAKDMLLLCRPLLDLKNSEKFKGLIECQNQCPVAISITDVIFPSIMRQRGAFIATFVAHILHKTNNIARLCPGSGQ